MVDDDNEHRTLLKRARLQGVTGIEAVDASGVRSYENFKPSYAVLFFPNENPQKVRYVGSNMEYEASGYNLGIFFEELAKGEITLLQPSSGEQSDMDAPFIESVMINYRTI